MFNSFGQEQPILISLSPNTEKDDILLALKLLFQPWRWKTTDDKKSAIAENSSSILEQKFRQYLGVKHAVTFNSGRTAWLAILKALELDKGKEVLLQGFTCNATVNPILHLGLKPVFLDIKEKTLNIDPADLERKITPASKIVLAQHTFGLPTDMGKIQTICQKYNLVLIEDCAHSLGAEYQGKKVGDFGQAAFFSFGRDKVISSVFGGIATTNDDSLAEKLRRYQQNLPQASPLWIFQQLLHPILTNFLIIPLYNFGDLGKWALIFLQKLGLLSKAVKREEKQGRMPRDFARPMPEAIAILALNQFRKLDRILAHQREIAEFYRQNLKNPRFPPPLVAAGRIYLRYPLLANNLKTDEILDEGRKRKIFLDDGWRKTAIAPPDTDQTSLGYRVGECPVAESAARRILNLPTHINISKEKAERIVNFLNDYHGD